MKRILCPWRVPVRRHVGYVRCSSPKDYLSQKMPKPEQAAVLKVCSLKVDSLTNKPKKNYTMTPPASIAFSAMVLPVAPRTRIFRS